MTVGDDCCDRCGAMHHPRGGLCQACRDGAGVVRVGDRLTAPKRCALPDPFGWPAVRMYRLTIEEDEESSPTTREMIP